MNNRPRNIAVLLAGGSGSRMGGDVPKQFLEVAGRTVLEWSIRAFASHPLIDEVAIVSRKDCVDRVEDIVQRGGYRLGEDGPLAKVAKVLTGGRERYDSSLSAIRAYEDDEVRLLLHDAVRPLVSQRIISDCLSALDSYEAVDVAIPCTDTIVEVAADGRICATPPRSALRCVQTPQGFRRGTIRRAYEVAFQDPAFQATDDCGVVFRYLPEVAIHVVEGETTNIKVTFPQDLITMEKVLEANGCV